MAVSTETRHGSASSHHTPHHLFAIAFNIITPYAASPFQASPHILHLSPDAPFLFFCTMWCKFYRQAHVWQPMVYIICFSSHLPTYVHGYNVLVDYRVHHDIAVTLNSKWHYKVSRSTPFQKDMSSLHLCYFSSVIQSFLPFASPRAFQSTHISRLFASAFWLWPPRDIATLLRTRNPQSLVQMLSLVACSSPL